MKIQLPANFVDISIDQWQQWHLGIDEIKAVQLFWQGDLSKVSVNALTVAYNHLNELFKEEDPRFYKVIEHDGEEYGFINDWDKFTTGEWVDIDTYLANPFENAHKVMSILYRPILRRTDKYYEIEEYKGSHERFKDLPVCYYLGALVFFCERKNELLKTSQASLMEVVKRMLSRSGGGGITQSSN